MSEEVIVVSHSDRLSGEVVVHGAKNSALKLMSAAILARGKTTLRNVPDIADIHVMSNLLESFGATCSNIDRHTVTIDTTNLDNWEAPYELVTKMRASISTLGSLIGRFGNARISMPGGCPIGARPIEMHQLALEQMGVVFDTDHGYLVASTPNGLHGAEIFLDFPSVGATENVLMAASVAEGETVLHNAAREPEIIDLCNMLNEMGASIDGIGTSDIRIFGVDISTMKPVDHFVCGDRIEAGTFLVAGILGGGPVTVHGALPEDLGVAIHKFAQTGGVIETGVSEDGIPFMTAYMPTNELIKSVDVQTLPFPGFATDLQSLFCVLNAIADGKSVITENLYENRFMICHELIRMGADIGIQGSHAIFTGVDHLQGTHVSCSDLRAGAALVLAGCIASGETIVHDIHHIDRGYEDFTEKLASIGANIHRDKLDI